MAMQKLVRSVAYKGRRLVSRCRRIVGGSFDGLGAARVDGHSGQPYRFPHQGVKASAAHAARPLGCGRLVSHGPVLEQCSHGEQDGAAAAMGPALAR